MENRVPRFIENYHRVLRIREFPRIRDIGSLQVHTGYVTFSLKKTVNTVQQASYHTNTKGF